MCARQRHAFSRGSSEKKRFCRRTPSILQREQKDNAQGFFHCPHTRKASPLPIFSSSIFFGRRIRRQHPLSPQALLSMPLLHTGAARLRYRPQPHACHLPAIACNKPCFSQNSPVLIFAFSPLVCYLQGFVTVALPVWRKVHKRGFASPCQKKAPFFVPSVPAFFRPCFFRLCPAFFGTQRITSVNKTILGLIAAVIVLGAALVLFNNAQKPEAVQNPKTELPALPDLAAERAAKSANLKEVPALPEAVENTASVRAPIVAPNTAPKTAPDNVQGTGEVAKAPVLAAANTARKAMPLPGGLLRQGPRQSPKPQSPQPLWPRQRPRLQSPHRPRQRPRLQSPSRPRQRYRQRPRLQGRSGPQRPNHPRTRLPRTGKLQKKPLQKNPLQGKSKSRQSPGWWSLSGTRVPPYA